MTFRLMVNCPHPVDGTSVYRAWGVLPELRHHNLELVRHPENVQWTDINDCDALFMQRPFLEYQVRLATFAKMYKKPIWIDYDDDLLSVEKDNPTYQVYSQQQFKDNVKKLCEMADVITTSTDVLSRKVKQFGQRVVTVPNALNMKLLNRMEEDLPRNKCVVWRGSSCHKMDLFQHTEEILSVYNSHPDWSWVFFGDNPWWITNRMSPERFRHVPFHENYITYMMNLQKMRGAINIIPLVDNEFNRAKSRICHLESSLAGSVVLGPNWEEWQGSSMFRYGNKKEFKDTLNALIEMAPSQHAAINHHDWQWVKENRTLEKVNKLRSGVITQLSGGM